MSRHPAHKLLIGLAPRILRQVPTELGFRGKTLQYFEQSVAHWVMSLGALVVMIPTVERQSLIRRTDIDIADYVAALDGLILQGGADIDPTLYGEERSGNIGPTDPVRDHFELELLRAFAAADKPVLGICRGMQLINVAFGGSLYQDLLSDQATTSRHHVQELYDEHVHALRFEPGSWLESLYGSVAEPRVNSIHHQAIRKLGRGLSVEAWSEDGIIESIRRSESGFMLGVQWHPEFHDARFPHLLEADPLLLAFIDAAARRRKL